MAKETLYSVLKSEFEMKQELFNLVQPLLLQYCQVCEDLLLLFRICPCLFADLVVLVYHPDPLRRQYWRKWWEALCRNYYLLEFNRKALPGSTSDISSTIMDPAVPYPQDCRTAGMMSPVLCFQTPLESIVLSHKDIQNQGVDPGTYEEQVQHFLLASRCIFTQDAWHNGGKDKWTRQYNTASKTAAAEQVDPDGWRHIGSVEEDVQTLFGFTDPLSGLIHHKDLALCPFCDWETSLALRVKMGEAEQGRFGEGSKKTAFLFVAQGFFRSPNRLDMSDIWRMMCGFLPTEPKQINTPRSELFATLNKTAWTAFITRDSIDFDEAGKPWAARELNVLTEEKKRHLIRQQALCLYGQAMTFQPQDQALAVGPAKRGREGEGETWTDIAQSVAGIAGSVIGKLGWGKGKRPRTS
ncbi:uncharacterized protein MKK02DRAFT_39392 [Dioszegia hungarica]|uniref:Uncharacterized protein n=1 Tax=Dioszegia hungarica TaxID=4972 RepID=A0AA38HHB7_9TREE|nr:uncharacterized protein MKK02DRAFT_39392 [Dioszegia hungarica]KAI9639114.1 hypothetical protein MKK02DRAFT_39392 [Dioszegia hungarica]